MKQILTKGFLLACAAGAVLQVDAQVYPYFVDFERDSIKAYASTDPVYLNGHNWVLPGVYLGDMEGSDRKRGLHSARIRLTANMSGDNGTMTMESDLSHGVDSVIFYHAMYGSETAGTVAVYYSTNQGATWTKAGADITPGNTLTRASVPIRTSAPTRISIRKTDGANVRINVDDIMITGYNGYASHVIVTEKSPVGRNVQLSVSSLTFKFNETVNKGTSGNIVLHNATDNTSQTFAVTSADVAVAGNLVTVSGVTLGSGKKYYVTFDSLAFNNGTLNSTGIYRETAWTFASVDTSALTSLNESFKDCSDQVYGVFRSFSIAGSQQWRCGSQGNTDNTSVYMNGGFSGGATDNEDWLITSGPLDLSAMSNPVLEFATKVRYSGATTKEVMVSTTYSGTGTPAGATWQSIKDVSNDISGTSWVSFGNIPLSSYKSAPFYLAFKYISRASAGGAEEWSVDDVVVSEGFPESVPVRSRSGLDISVLGATQDGSVRLSVVMPEAADVQVVMHDLTGRAVYTQAHAGLQAGRNLYTIDRSGLAAGMYLIRVANANYQGTVKAIVQ